MEVCQGSVLNSDLSENVAYNNPVFPAYIKRGQLSNYPDFRAVSHWHDDLEFILILEGQMSYDVNGQKLSLQAGEGIFVNSRCFHYGYSDAHNECIFIIIREKVHIFRKQPEDVNGFLKDNKRLYFIYIIFVEHFKITKDSILPLDSRHQLLIRKMHILDQWI